MFLFNIQIFQGDITKDYRGVDATIEILIMLFVAALLGFAIGYFIRRPKKEYIFDNNETEISFAKSIQETEISKANNKKEKLVIQNEVSETLAISNDTKKATAKKTKNNIQPEKEIKVTPKVEVSNTEKTPKTSKRTSKVLKTEDLTLIEGIGPAISKWLNENGINSMEQLAETKVDTLQEILDKAGSRFVIHTPATWPMQAGVYLSGDKDAFEALKKELKGGRIVK
jgi:predicted flap endonuclease-1-like 5' DNA nuclease